MVDNSFMSKLNLAIKIFKNNLFSIFWPGVPPTERSKYQERLFDFKISQGDKVLDIGSGAVPFKFATELVDLYQDDNRHRGGIPIKRDGRLIHVANIEALPFADKSFDFVYCSHVLEHVQNPAKACDEIMRVGHRGYIETPSRLSDFIFNTVSLGFHIWQVDKINNKLIFRKYSKREKEGINEQKFFDLVNAKYGNFVQNCFWRSPDQFYTMFYWENRFEYLVIEN
jgi:SAM-dependent methyltransferase